jgi:hypothetical protein
MVGLAFLSAAVAVDRQRASWILYALTAASTVVALGMLARDLIFPDIGFDAFMRDQATDCAAIGVIIAGAAYIRTIERSETHHSYPQRSDPNVLRFSFASSTASLAVCVTALIFGATYWTIFASGCGLAALACVPIIRRIARGPGAAVAIAATPLVIAMLLLACHPPAGAKSLPFAFASSSASLIAVSERVLKDGPLVGTGAGTFAAIAPIYREMDDPPPGAVPATTAAAFAIELGRPMFWLIAVATVSAISVLLRASLRRGRDSYYPAVAGSCLITLLLLAFVNAGMLGTAPSLMVAAALGVGFAQRKGRTAQL